MYSKFQIVDLVFLDLEFQITDEKSFKSIHLGTSSNISVPRARGDGDPIMFVPVLEKSIKTGY